MTNPTVPVIENPVGIDAAIIGVNDLLLERLNWLDYAFGKAEKLERMVNRKRERAPGIYVGVDNREYLSLLPDSHLGNYSWVDVDDGYEVEWHPGQDYYLTANCSWVFWYDSESVFVDPVVKTNRHAVDEVLGAMKLAKGLTVVSVYERGENIYRGYDLGEEERKALVRPYMGFRVECELRYLRC